MRDNARECFQSRFLIDRTAESFIEAMELFGMRKRPLTPLNQVTPG